VYRSFFDGRNSIFIQIKDQILFRGEIIIKMQKLGKAILKCFENHRARKAPIDMKNPDIM
jgi:hypothetical protein